MKDSEQITRWRRTAQEQAQRYMRVKYLWWWYQTRDALLRVIQAHKVHGVFVQSKKQLVFPAISRRKKHCIFLSQVEWESMTQRPHHLARGLSTQGVDVWFINPSFVDAKKHTKPLIRTIAPHLFVVTLSSTTPYLLHRDVCTTEDAALFAKQLMRLFGTIPKQQVKILTEHAFWSATCTQLSWEITYDCIDDVTGFAVKAPGVLEQERRLCEIATHVSATSPLLVRKLKQYRDDVSLLPNGCDLENFRFTQSQKGPLSSLSRPRIVYYGFLDIWFDRSLVRSIARAMPDASIVLIGPVADPRIYELGMEENIILTGKVPYTELARYLKDTDVFIIPFRLIPLILATDPVKFYEMLSMGKPIVASKLPALLPFAKKPALLSLASSKEEWVKKITMALRSHSPTQMRQRKMESNHHTWDVRVQALYNNMYET